MVAGKDSTVRAAQPAWIAQGLAVVAMALLLACGYRLVWLERHRAPELREKGARQQRSMTWYPACRGSIVDSNPARPDQHITLAASFSLDSVYLDPSMIATENRQELVDRLADILKLGAGRQKELNDRLLKAESAMQRLADERAAKPSDPSGALASAARDPALRSFPVQRLVAPEESARIRELRGIYRREPSGARGRPFAGVALVPEFKREYPAGTVAPHQVGFVNEFGEAQAGLERQFDDKLRGLDGSKRVIADAGRRPIWSGERDYVRPQDGLTMVLNISAVIQSYTDGVLAETVKEFQAESGVAAVMDPQTGAVLAISNVPTYVADEYGQSKRDAVRNRALTDPFEPGSIFKWVVVAGAIERKKVTENDMFDCHGGSWTIGRRTIHDAHAMAGMHSVREIVVHSSNIGMSQIAINRICQQQTMYDIIASFGFGHKTGIELSDVESPGLLYPIRRWTGPSLASLSFGQGEIMVTPIQMLAAFSAIANGGDLLRPRLVRAMVDDSQIAVGGSAKVIEDYSARSVRRKVLSEKTCKTMLSILTDVVDNGTGKNARIEGVKVFGKTGTAQIGHNGVYVKDAWTSSFIGGAPAEAPKLVVIVSLRKPNVAIAHHGSTVAAPAVRKILEKSLAFLQAK